MKIRLRHYYISSKIECFDIRFRGPAPVENSLDDGAPVGFYERLGADDVALFAAGGKLFLSLEGFALELPEGHASARHSTRGRRCELELSVDGETHRFSYPAGPGPVSTLWYSEDEEDADFGLWIHNVLNSAERRRSFIEWNSRPRIEPEEDAS